MGERVITVIGMGPGELDYITPIAWSKAKEASILIGSDRLLDLFPNSKAKKISISSKMRLVVDGLEEIKDEKVAVLVSGDPGLFSLLGMIKEKIDAEYIDVIPGISAAQILFSKSLTSWDDVAFISLHGRVGKVDRLLKAAKKNRRLAVFNGPDFTADRIAESLIAAGYEGIAVIGQQLSYGDETVEEMTLKELGERKGIEMAVILLNITDGRQMHG